MQWRSVPLFVLVFVGLASASQPATTQPSTQPFDETNILAMGDWGEDTAAQRQVAAEMARYVQASHKQFTAVLLLGDNFYFRLTGVDDPRWQTLFEQMYDPKVLGMPFYACLGNHDYDGDNFHIELTYAKEHPHSRFKMPAPWYRLNMPHGKPTVMALMLDSNKDNLSELQWNRQI
ncbi:MAG TPA: metallophosphoesterase, partial [Tepidisphaeraceae bacterium]|nr:metallophosphoesterase [Tepidisphaeraceae bacterium]